jgi:hypothetical protein
MEQISEDYRAASWLTDLEYRLWQLAQDAGEGAPPAWPLSVEDGIVLRRLSELCQGWWAWDDATHDVVFASLPGWRPLAEAVESRS